MEELSFGVVFEAVLSMIDPLMPIITLLIGVLLGSLIIHFLLSYRKDVTDYMQGQEKEKPVDEETARAWRNFHLANRYASRTHHHRARISKRVSSHRY